MSAREVGGYMVAGLIPCMAAVLANVSDYGWAWNWPGSGLGIPAALLGAACALMVSIAAAVRGATRPRGSGWAVVTRWGATLAIPLAFVVTNCSLGPLAKSRGRGLVDRLRRVTPLPVLESWAAGSLRDRAVRPLPDAVARTLPPHHEVRLGDDSVVLWWYDTGVVVSTSARPRSAPAFFWEEVRPGIYVEVVED